MGVGLKGYRIPRNGANEPILPARRREWGAHRQRNKHGQRKLNKTTGKLSDAAAKRGRASSFVKQEIKPDGRGGRAIKKVGENGVTPMTVPGRTDSLGSRRTPARERGDRRSGREKVVSEGTGTARRIEWED